MSTLVRPARPAPPAGDRPPRLLQRRTADPNGLDFDAYQRYALAASLVERLGLGSDGPVRVLELGDGPELAGRFFDPAAVEVTRITGAAPVVPAGDEAFDVVVALDMLPRLPADARPGFLRDCLRASKRGAVITTPDGSPAVAAAERTVADAYERRHGRPHPVLAEHARFGLPGEGETRDALRALDLPFTVVGNAPLDAWLGQQLLGEHLGERGASAELRSRWHFTYGAGVLPGGPTPYRKCYVVAKGFEATAALDLASVEGGFGKDEGRNPSPNPSPKRGGERNPSPMSSACRSSAPPSLLGKGVGGLGSDPLNQLASLTGGMLATLDEELRAERAARESDLTLAEEERAKLVHGWQQQCVILESILNSLTKSRAWKLFGPLRYLRRQLSPRGFDQRQLIPWRDLELIVDEALVEPDLASRAPLLPLDPHEPPPTVWGATCTDPQFVVPCLLSPGWVRVRLALTGPRDAEAEIYVDAGHGFQPHLCVERFNWSETLIDDLYLYLPEPVRAIRFDPLHEPGQFRIERFEVQPLSGPGAAWHAVTRKLQLLRDYHCTGRVLLKGLGMALRGRFGAVGKKLFKALPDTRRLSQEPTEAGTAYDRWRKKFVPDAAECDRQRQESAAWADAPVFSVLMPTYNTPWNFLQRAVESVRRQTYPHWQLCVADDGSTSKHVRQLLDHYAKLDPRIRVSYAERNGGIAAASNRALAMAEGDYVALLDHDDELAEHALFRFAERIRQNPEADFLYSDEDKVEPDGRHVAPFFKPDWSPEYFLTCMYTCHLGVYRAKLAREVGGFRSEFDNAQDYDLALRIVARIEHGDRKPAGPDAPRRVEHIPDVLYHWRKHEQSTAASHTAKPTAERIARSAVQDFVRRIGRPATVKPGPGDGLHRVRYALTDTPKVSIVIPSACRPAVIRGKPTVYVTHCLRSIRRRSTYTNYEVLVIDNDDVPAALAKQLDDLGVVRVPYLGGESGFNLSAKMNLGAAKADGEYLLFLNDDTEVITPDWIECLLEYAQWPEIGAVGARLLFPDGKLQHAGVTLLGARPHHHFYNYPGHEPGYWHANLLPKNYSAVTGACLLTRADLYHSVGGFDEAFPLNYNDIDYCLKVRDTGRRVVYQPYAQLYHFESASKTGTYEHELDRFLARWGDRYALDPYYSPHLSDDHVDYRIAKVE